MLLNFLPVKVRVDVSFSAVEALSFLQICPRSPWFCRLMHKSCRLFEKNKIWLWSKMIMGVLLTPFFRLENIIRFDHLLSAEWSCNISSEEDYWMCLICSFKCEHWKLFVLAFIKCFYQRSWGSGLNIQLPVGLGSWTLSLVRHLFDIELCGLNFLPQRRVNQYIHWIHT